jgi:actin cytoskeleton-regulatory complex protein PAN1
VDWYRVCILDHGISTANCILSRLDLTAPTRNMGPRKLLKEGTLLKSKSGRKLHAYLCSDILVLTDISMKNLYRMVCLFLAAVPVAHAPQQPIALADSNVTEVPGKGTLNNACEFYGVLILVRADDLGFQISLPYPRGGETIALRATSIRDCQRACCLSIIFSHVSFPKTVWIEAIEHASRKCKEADRRAARRRTGTI